MKKEIPKPPVWSYEYENYEEIYSILKNGKPIGEIDYLEDAKNIVDNLNQVENWRFLTEYQNLSVAAVARDENYKCQCGEQPYTNGEECPKCFSISALELIAKVRKKLLNE